jgi:dynein heavy chain
MVLDDLVEKLPDQFDMEDIRGRTDEITPYIMVGQCGLTLSNPF